LLALLRVGQACLDHWHEAGAHPAVLSCYRAGLLEWYVVPGHARSLEAGHDKLATLPSLEPPAATVLPAPASPAVCPPRSPQPLPAPLRPESVPAVPSPPSPEPTPMPAVPASGLSSATAGEPDQLPGAGVEPSGGRWSAADVALG